MMTSSVIDSLILPYIPLIDDDFFDADKGFSAGFLAFGIRLKKKISDCICSAF